MSHAGPGGRVAGRARGAVLARSPGALPIRCPRAPPTRRSGLPRQPGRSDHHLAARIAMTGRSAGPTRRDQHQAPRPTGAAPGAVQRRGQTPRGRRVRRPVAVPRTGPAMVRHHRSARSLPAAGRGPDLAAGGRDPHPGRAGSAARTAGHRRDPGHGRNSRGPWPRAQPLHRRAAPYSLGHDRSCLPLTDAPGDTPGTVVGLIRLANQHSMGSGPCDFMAWPPATRSGAPGMRPPAARPPRQSPRATEWALAAVAPRPGPRIRQATASGSAATTN